MQKNMLKAPNLFVFTALCLGFILTLINKHSISQGIDISTYASEAQLRQCQDIGERLFHSCVPVGEPKSCSILLSDYVVCIGVLGAPGNGLELDKKDEFSPYEYTPCRFVISHLILSDVCN
jgi:hypothetical protein